MELVLFATLIWQVIDFIRELANWRTQRSAIVTQVTAWIGGVVVIALGAHAAVVSTMTLPGMSLPLSKLDAGSVIVVGLMASSLASSLVDTKQAIDGRDSAAKPPLLGPAPAG